MLASEIISDSLNFPFFSFFKVSVKQNNEMTNNKRTAEIFHFLQKISKYVDYTFHLNLGKKAN